MVFDAVGAGKAFVEFKNVMLADLEAESIPYSVVNAEVDIASNEFEIEKFNSPSSAVISCPDDSKTAEVVFVSYNEGRVVSADIVSVTLKKGVNEVFVSEVFSCENADTVKILLWEGLEYITPLCKPLTVSL